MNRIKLFLFFLLLVSKNVYGMNSIEQEMREIQNKLQQQMRDAENAMRNPSFGDFGSFNNFSDNSKIAEAEKILKAGLGDWIWYGKIYDLNVRGGTKYIPITLRKSENGARLMVYVFMSSNGRIDLQPRLVFDSKTDIKQEGFGIDKEASIEGRFDRLPWFDETMPQVPDGSDKIMYLLGDDTEYDLNRFETRTAMWMLLEARKFSIKFNSDFFASDSGARRTATFYLAGLEDMILQALIVLSGRLNRNDDPERLLDRFIDETN